MSDFDATLARRALDRVRELLDDAEDQDHRTVAVADVRAQILAATRCAKNQRPPHLGDVVLIRATVQPDTDRDVPAGTLIVHVPVWTSNSELVIHADTVVEVLGPSWWPPREGDVVLDHERVAWQYDGTGTWHCLIADSVTSRRLAEVLGPLTLLARDGEKYEGC